MFASVWKFPLVLVFLMLLNPPRPFGGYPPSCSITSQFLFGTIPSPTVTVPVCSSHSLKLIIPYRRRSRRSLRHSRELPTFVFFCSRGVFVSVQLTYSPLLYDPVSGPFWTRPAPLSSASPSRYSSLLIFPPFKPTPPDTPSHHTSPLYKPSPASDMTLPMQICFPEEPLLVNRIAS